jgi:hypothetical protein
MPRYCSGPHVEQAYWRTKVERSSSGTTSRAWCNECKDKELAKKTPAFKAEDFEPIIQAPKSEEQK